MIESVRTSERLEVFNQITPCHMLQNGNLCVQLHENIKFNLSGFNPWKRNGYYMYHKVLHLEIPLSAHTVYLRVLYGSENQQRLFPYTALTDWFL
jgi:hypothetical protein